MKNRLEVARELLKDDGVIFVQCDDNEQAYLKVLMDEVFGNENFVCNFVWKGKSGGANDSRHIAIDQEYVLCFGKNINSLNFNLDINAEVSTIYNLKDEKGEYSLDRLDKQSLGYLASLDFPIKDKNGKKYFVKHKNSTKIARWRWGRETVKDRFDELVFKDNKVYTKNYKKDGSIPRSLLVSKRFSRTRTGKTEHFKLFEEYLFNNPKPENLLYFLIQISTKPNDIVIDYHLGSGTTCAVAHKMNRQYIGIEQMDYIEDIAVERIKKVINGEQGGISKSLNWKGGGDFIYMEIKKFNKEFEEKIQKEKTNEELKTIFQEMNEKAFLSYKFSENEFSQKIKDFDNLTLNQQKQVLIEILDKNQMYLPLSEIEDKNMKVSKNDIENNKSFYEKL